jgi:uncharacterized DUF497 family protein
MDILVNLFGNGGNNPMATVSFELGGMAFEYDEEKNRINIKKHGIDFRSAARVFFDYDRIEIVDENHSNYEERYDTIGDTSAGNSLNNSIVIGTPLVGDNINDILFVVYTDRIKIEKDGQKIDVTRLISARLATEFERGVYYGKC